MGALVRVLASFALVFACATACTDIDDERQSGPVSAEEAARFGDIAIPNGAEVLATSTDGAIDTRYELALRVNAAQLAQLLTQSHFAKPVTPSKYGKERKVAGGPVLSGATDLRYAQDRIDTAEHGTVTREIFKDRRSPDEIYVHLFLFTT